MTSCDGVGPTLMFAVPARRGFSSTKRFVCVCTSGTIAPIVRRLVTPYDSENGVVTMRVSAVANVWPRLSEMFGSPVSVRSADCAAANPGN